MAATFTASFSAALVEKEAASGRAIVVKDIVAEPATMTSKTVQVVISPTPAPAPAPAPAPGGPSPGGPSPGGPSPPASKKATPAPTPSAPAKKKEEEESDNGAVIGGVVGGVVGVGVLGGAAYMYKKKSAQE